MKIPAEFEDIFRGVELTEKEARFLVWITSWDNYTIQNMRTILKKARTAGPPCRPATSCPSERERTPDGH